ncbi:MAG: TIGR00730 family Rossman fold protein [Alphaproteobacteria bacterium]
MDHINSICVYLGSSGCCQEIFKQTAQELGTLIAQNNKTLIYGGMDVGLMGIIANTVMENGGAVTGVVPANLKDSKRAHMSLSRSIWVETLWERKLEMFNLMDAAIILPGGFGTADEVLEILYWASLGLHTKPVVIINTQNYYEHLIAFLRTLPELPKDQLIIADTPQEAFAKLKTYVPIQQSTQAATFPHFENSILQNKEKPIIIETTSIEDSTLLLTALGLKQMQKHARAIGILNTKGQFDLFLKWIERAQEETFITRHCTRLYNVGTNKEELKKMLKTQPIIKIDLASEKWGG